MNIGDPDDPTYERILALVIIALVFTLINMFIAPIVKTLSIPFIVVTLGLFLLVINAILLLLTKWITDVIDLVVFHIDGFWWALLGGLIVSIVNAFLGGAVKRNACFSCARFLPDRNRMPGQYLPLADVTCRP